MLLLFTDWQTEEMTSHTPTNGLKVAFSFKCQHLNTNIIVGRKIPAMLQASFTHNTTRVRTDFFSSWWCAESREDCFEPTFHQVDIMCVDEVTPALPT